ncbi:hypothetical protein EI94DRAFT_1700524 [Lactarius quietus]|nr:hypothetical protein EI94DRAFT_1700524 [Lactarius quietus]
MPPPLDLNLIQGPWKHCPPQCKLEKSDPQARKKTRVTAAQGKQLSAKVSQHAAIGDVCKDVPESSDNAPCTSPSPGMHNAASENGINSDGLDKDKEVEAEDDITDLSNWVSKKWDAPIYVFFKPVATIDVSYTVVTPVLPAICASMQRSAGGMMLLLQIQLVTLELHMTLC